jgi:hypothetical protein
LRALLRSFAMSANTAASGDTRLAIRSAVSRFVAAPL